MSDTRDKYDIKMRPSRWQIFCALIGHVPYRTRLGCGIEFGCERCGMSFKHSYQQEGS